MKALKPYGAKRCVLCRRAWAPNKVEHATVNGVTGLWVCKSCSGKIACYYCGAPWPKGLPRCPKCGKLPPEVKL